MKKPRTSRDTGFSSSLRRYPPMKYLSESHLNSLGICLFLASARLVNAEAGFLVLDDIRHEF
ncbi:MAG: hypothetical protein ACRD3W_02715 [Terriglobales bacterium]